MRKFTILISLLFCFILFFGCINNASENDFLELKSNYVMVENINLDLLELNNYLNELSLLREKSSGGLAKIIDYELFSIEAFVNFSKALEESQKINYFSNHCSSIEYKNTINYLTISINQSNQANSIILLPNEKELLRKNQVESTKELNRLAKELKESIINTC